MEKEIKKEFGNLARMVKVGFDEAQKDRAKIRQEIREGFSNVNARFDMLECDIQGLVTRDEFEDLMGRVKYLEQKLGVESGK